MKISPKVREFLCLTAHPEGCQKNVENQITYVKKHSEVKNGQEKIPRSSERPPDTDSHQGSTRHSDAVLLRSASCLRDRLQKGLLRRAETVNTAAFEHAAANEDLYAKTVNGDAFSKEVKDQVMNLIKKDLGKVDAVIYSLAAPRRTAEDGTVYQSVLKTTGEDFTNKNLNLKDNTIGEKTIEAATEEEVEATVKVMGGEDWKAWIRALTDADAIEEGRCYIRLFLYRTGTHLSHLF